MTTRSKRASSVGLGLFWLLSPVLPDATLDQGDRQHTAISYSGILATSLISAVADTTVIVREGVGTVIVRPDPSVIAR